jgi:thioredoxin 1
MSVEVTDNTFDKFITDTDVSMVVFSAPWCGPCRMLAPVLEMLAKDNPDVNIGKVNIENEAQSTMKYEVKSIPAIVFFKGGAVVDRMVGATNKGVLQGKINAIK